MRSRVLRMVVALAAAFACLAASAAANPPRPADLRVVGGEDAWHPENRFELEWVNPVEGGPPLAAVHYRIRDPQGTAIYETRLGWLSDGVAALTLPKTPGAYTVEVWLEDSQGAQGPAATARLRFDDARPGAIGAPPVSGWIGRTAFPLRVRLDHPPGPAPLSGIRGYAVSIGAAPNTTPCAAADRCADTEVALRGGVDDDTLTIPALPEGTSYLHAVAVSGAGMKSAASAPAVLRVDTTDPVTRLSGATPGWTNQTVQLTARATDSGSGMGPDGAGPPPFTAIGVDGGAPAIALGGSAATDVIGEGVHRVAYYARDAAGNVDDGADSNGIPNLQPRTTWVRIDRSPPSVAFANSQIPHDPDLIRVRISDPLSGPEPSRGSIGVRRAGSGDRFQPLPAAPQGEGELRARWDSDSYPAGEYEFRAIGYDAAGNAAAATRRANGTPMVLSNPLKATTTLRVGFRHGRQRTVPYGRRVLLRGRLTTGASSPLGGVSVRVVERFPPGAGSAQVSTVRTKPDGAFSLHTAPGPSRTIEVAFDGNPTLASSTGPTLHLMVRSRVRFQASSGFARVGGAPLVFSGQIAALPGEISTGGKSVQLQFRLPGLPWAEFRTIQTDRRGRFRYAYRFSDDDSRGARFQFRAYVPAQENWPYEPAGSRPILLRGR